MRHAYVYLIKIKTSNMQGKVRIIGDKPTGLAKPNLIEFETKTSILIIFF